MNVAEYERLQRWCRTTATWMRKSTALCCGAADRTQVQEVRWLVGYEAGRMLHDVVEHAGLLVPLLNADEVEDVEQLARDLHGALRRRRLSDTLGNVEGRTPEEAEAFLAKAGELSTTREGA